MRRRSSILAALVVAAIAAAPTTASAEKTLRSMYQQQYAKVEQKLGNGSAGRNIVKDGVKGDRPASHKQIARSIRTMRRMVAPQPTKVVVQSTNLTATASTGPSGGTGCGASCQQCESNGNPQAVSPAGYWGKYQFDRQTWEAHGGSPGSYGSAGGAEQDQVASRITYDAWPNC